MQDRNCIKLCARRDKYSRSVLKLNVLLWYTVLHELHIPVDTFPELASCGK